MEESRAVDVADARLAVDEEHAQHVCIGMAVTLGDGLVVGRDARQVRLDELAGRDGAGGLRVGQVGSRKIRSGEIRPL